MSDGITVTRSHPSGGTPLTASDLDRVPGATYRRLANELNRVSRERVQLYDESLATARQLIAATEEIARLKRQIERLVRMPPDHVALLREEGLL